MDKHQVQLSVSALLWIVAAIAFNFWLFRLGFLWGLIGVNISKHVVIAQLCQFAGVNRREAKTMTTGPAGRASASASASA
jgi:apolipoprotein N-acyltransferase